MNIEQKLQEAEDRLAIRNLIDKYAFCADTRDATGQMALFTEDTTFEVYYDPTSGTPSEIVQGRSNLFPVFDHLNTYHSTLHFNAQNSVTLEGTSARGITYCMAHHLTLEEGHRKLMIATIRYQDKFVKLQERWLFEQRKLFVDWITTQ